jgi:hypothetical protein
MLIQSEGELLQCLQDSGCMLGQLAGELLLQLPAMRHQDDALHLYPFIPTVTISFLHHSAYLRSLQAVACHNIQRQLFQAGAAGTQPMQQTCPSWHKREREVTVKRLRQKRSNLNLINI